MAGSFAEKCGADGKNGKKSFIRDFGEMMFTHSGITGPLVLSASSRTGHGRSENQESFAAFRGFEACTVPRSSWIARMLREFESGKNKQFKNVIIVLFPSSLTPVMLEESGILPEKPIS